MKDNSLVPSSESVASKQGSDGKFKIFSTFNSTFLASQQTTYAIHFVCDDFNIFRRNKSEQLIVILLVDALKCVFHWVHDQHYFEIKVFRQRTTSTEFHRQYTIEMDLNWGRRYVEKLIVQRVQKTRGRLKTATNCRRFGRTDGQTIFRCRNDQFRHYIVHRTRHIFIIRIRVEFAVIWFFDLHTPFAVEQKHNIIVDSLAFLNRRI